MKSARQLKDLIRNVAKQKDLDSHLLMRNYMLERLLERISVSELKDKFILKKGACARKYSDNTLQLYKMKVEVPLYLKFLALFIFIYSKP